MFKIPVSDVPLFLSDVCEKKKLSIGLISTALRSGTPIPQITPCPLLNRFLRYSRGFNLVQEEEDDEFGLPKTATIDLLEDEQYMYGVSPVSLLTLLP